MTLDDFSLVLAEREHAALVFGWRNDPEIVALGRSRSKVTWEEHSAWFQRVIEDAASLLLIVLTNHSPVGQIRFDPSPGNAAEVSIYLLGHARGRGLGSAVLREGCAMAVERLQLKRIFAHVRCENQAARRLFEGAGFSLRGGDDEFARYVYKTGDAW